MIENKNDIEVIVDTDITKNTDLIRKDPEGFLRSYVEQNSAKQITKHQESDKEDDVQSAMSAVEKEAYKQGWRPKEIYEGKAENWIPASQFLKNGTFMSQTHALSKEVTDLKNQIAQLLNLSKTQAKIFAEEKANEASKKSQQAFEERNLEEMRKYESMYNEYNKEVEKYSKEIAPPSKQQQIPMEVLNFKERNGNWFNSNSPINTAMVAFATQTDEMLKAMHPEWSLERRLGEVEISTKKQFSGNFQNEYRNESPMVESGRNGMGSQQQQQNIPKFEDLDEFSRKIILDTVNITKDKFTKEDYMRELFK